VSNAAGTEARKNIRNLATTSGLAKDIAAQSKQHKAKNVLQEEDFPALDAGKTPGLSLPVTEPTQPKVTPATIPVTASKKGAAEPPSVATMTAPASSKKSDKRPAPGVLNIAAATKAAQPKQPETPLAVDKIGNDLDTFPSLPTPTTASVSSPVVRNAPRTLRVVPTPKAELSSVFNLAGAAADIKTSATNRPSTPASEVISDNASVISASVSASRASSPPPKGSSAAVVRAGTKSQKRQQRKQASKKELSAIASQPVPEQETVDVAPILGRKKKQKKEKANNAGAAHEESRPTTPVADPSSPAIADPVKEEVIALEKTAEKGKAKETTVAVDSKLAINDSAPPASPSGATKTEAEAAVASTDKAEPERELTPFGVVQDLVTAGEIDQPEMISILHPPIETTYRIDHKGVYLGRDTALSIQWLLTDEDYSTLSSGQVVRKVVDDVRILITPNGDCIRNLSEQEEERFLSLQRQVAAMASDPSSYVYPRHDTPAKGYAMVKGRAVANGPPSYVPAAASAPLSSMDLVAKIQRDETIYWINQHVLPSGLAGTNWKGVIADNMAAHGSGLGYVAPWIYGSENAAGVPDPGAAQPPPPRMSVEDTESALAVARREAEKLDKRMNQMVKKNRGLLLKFGGS
jgi:hypothetical protein